MMKTPFLYEYTEIAPGLTLDEHRRSRPATPARRPSRLMINLLGRALGLIA
jgi:hypothetical protein